MEYDAETEQEHKELERGLGFEKKSQQAVNQEKNDCIYRQNKRSKFNQGRDKTESCLGYLLLLLVNFTRNINKQIDNQKADYAGGKRIKRFFRDCFKFCYKSGRRGIKPRQEKNHDDKLKNRRGLS